jgi:hypothetical protein
MNKRNYFTTLAILPLLSLSAVCTANTDPLSFDQLTSERQRLKNKTITVVGYFDAKERVLLGSMDNRDYPVAIDLTQSQLRTFRQKGTLKSGYVTVRGKLEVVDPPKNLGPIDKSPGSGIAVLVPVGFRGAYRAQISKISQFQPLPKVSSENLTKQRK